MSHQQISWRPYSQRTLSPSASVQVVHAMNPTVQAILILAAILTTGVATYAAVKASIAEREARLQRLETDEMKVALKMQGIKIHEDVLEGSSP